MIWDIGLLVTIALSAGFALEIAGHRDRRTLTPVLLLAGAVILWCGGELLLRHTAAPEGALWARRLLYVGLCALGPVWLWTGMRIHPSASRRRSLRHLLAGIVAIEVVVYSSLYWGEHLLATGPSNAPTHGPLFLVHALVQWTAIAVALGLVATTAAQMRGGGRVAAAAVLLGIAIPLLANWAYLGLGVPDADPTPVLVGFSAVVFRFAVLDLVGVPFVAAHARLELLQQMDGGVLVADARGRVLEANRAARELLGAADPVGRPISEVVAPFDRDPGIDVHRFPLQRHHIMVGAGVLLTDRRAARAAERQAEAATRLEGLGILASGLAHEIDDPLRTVLGKTAELSHAIHKSAGVDRSSARESLVHIERAADRIAEIVRRMGHLARFNEEEQTCESCDALTVLGRSISLSSFGKEPGEVKLYSESGPTWVAARATDLTQILLHLLMAALRANRGVEPVEAYLECGGDGPVVRILDCGTQLPNDPSRIFDPFYGHDRDDGGLGLSLAWELTRLNGGFLEARRREGGGAEYRLTLAAAGRPLDALDQAPEGVSLFADHANPVKAEGARDDSDL